MSATLRQVAEAVVRGATNAYGPHEGITAAILDLADAVREQTAFYRSIGDHDELGPFERGTVK